MLGILKDLGYVPQADVLGDVVGEEMGEDVALALAQSGLRLPAEDALVHSLPPVDYHGIVEEAKRVIKQITLELPDGPCRYIPLGGDSTRRITVAQSIKNGQPFESRQWLTVGRPCWLFTKFFQFFPYWRFFLSWGDSAPGSS